MFESKAQQVAAAIVAVAYIAVQTFQWYVFSYSPRAEDPAQALLLGAAPMNIARAALLLLSFFALAYLFLVACSIAWRRSPGLAIAAFLSFFVFCLLEVQLRSIELFYVFLYLPQQYDAAAGDAPAQASLLGIASTFGAIQYAVYFPLSLTFLLGSVLLCFARGGSRFDWIARFAFGLNATRLLLRMIDAYLIGPKFDGLYATLYLPLVYLTFGALAFWFLRRERPAQLTRAPVG